MMNFYIENIPLYMQIPLSVEVYKLNNALNASTSQMTIKGKLFRKKKLVGSTPFKLVDSSTQKSNYMSTMEFLCNLPYDEISGKLVKGPVTSTTVFPPINEAISNVEENNDSNSTSAAVGEGKFLQIVVNKKLHTSNKIEFVNEMLVDLSHYCLLNSEYQCRISVPFELSSGVTVNITMIIFSTIGNQLLGRKSGSLDLSRPMTATNTSPSREVSVDVSPKISPQINRVLSADLDDSPFINSNTSGNNNNNGSSAFSPTNYSNSTSSLNGNNASNGVQDFFKRRAELNSGRSRSGSSPIAMQHTPYSPQPYEPSTFNNPTSVNTFTEGQNSGTLSDPSPSLIDTGVVPNREENIDVLRQENQHLKSVLQRAKVRFQEVVSENSQLKERIKQLEEQMTLLQTASSPNPFQGTTSKDLLDFF